MKARSLSANALALAFSSGGSAVLAFLLTVLIGRATGDSGLGVYAAALAWVFPLSLVVEFGISTLLTRQIAQTPHLAGSYWQSALRLRAIMGGGLLVLLWLIAPLLSHNAALVEGIRLSAPLVVLVPLFSTISAIFRAQQVMLPIAALNIGMLLVQVALTALVFATGGTLREVFLVNTLTSLGQVIAAWGWVRYRFAYLFVVGARHASPLPMRHILRQSAPFALAAILAAVQGRVNILLLEQLSSAAQVGYYAAAFKFLEAARLVPLAFFDALFPRLATLAEHPPQLERLFRRILGALAGYGLVVGLGLNLIAHGLMGIYGTAFLPASTVLQVGAWSLLPLLLKQGRTLYWYAQGQEQHVNRITLMVLALQIVLALWLIPSGQALGAAVALILSESCAALLLWRGKRVRVVSERLTSAP